MINPQDLTNILFLLYNEDGSMRIVDNTLVALTLMIAESRTEEKDTIVSKSSLTYLTKTTRLNTSFKRGILCGKSRAE